MPQVPLGFEHGTGGHAETEEEMMANPRSVVSSTIDTSETFTSETVTT